MAKIKISNVFRTTGQPTTTYVARENGSYERLLRAGLESEGRLCLLTGPSKTGKTTLHTHVLREMKRTPVIVRCDNQLSPEDFWKQALEAINFDRIASANTSESSETSASGKIRATFGWAWLAGIIGEVSLGVKKSMSETTIRQRILAKPSPKHLLPALRYLPLTLVVEDFHYLSAATKKTIFQQWKAFVDGEVSVIVVGTTHHAVDLARANKDLVGRITQIEVTGWMTEDLQKIAEQGFKHLQINLEPTVYRILAREAAGLPIVIQDTCRQLFLDRDLSQVQKKHAITFSSDDAYLALHNVASTNYSQLEALYDRLITGPRKKRRKYETYELILGAFARDPIVLSLRRHEIDERIDQMGLRPEKRPPTQSIDSTLRALADFQTRNGLELLEWSAMDQKLFIIEPTFLFYLRWRTKRSRPPTARETLQALFLKFDVIASLFAKYP